MTDANPLAGVREALKRGTKAAVLRRVVAVCDKQHILAEVFAGDDGELYAVGQYKTIQDGVHVRLPHVERISESRSPGEPDVTLMFSCGCNSVFGFLESVLFTAMRNGQKRVVVRVSE